jgi:hypothetical protein
MSGGSLSEVVSSLLSGVVGALVGGATSLGGSMLVNKQERQLTACQRIYSRPRTVMRGWDRSRLKLGKKAAADMILLLGNCSTSGNM